MPAVGCVYQQLVKTKHSRIAPERSKISHAIMHKANACRSLNGQMHDLATEQSSWKGKEAKVSLAGM